MDQTKKKEERPLILIVEDHLETRTFLELLLGDEFILETAESATEALQKVKENSFDLFLVDIALRDSVDGTQLVGMLRDTVADKNTPMIAMTAHQLNEDRQYYLDHGFDDYIGKPFFPEDLLTIIRGFLAKRNHVVDHQSR